MINGLQARHAMVFLGLAAAPLGGCGSDANGPMVSNESWAQAGILLGEWGAVHMEHRSQADPSRVAFAADSFTLSVDVRGQYEAAFVATAITERGWVRVEPPSVTFRPTQPPGADAPGSILALGDTVVVSGDSEFDFGDGLEPSVLTLPLLPR